VASRCALWARVSKDERESGNQLGELRAEATRRDLDIAAGYVLDGASAWKGEHRELPRQALEDIASRGVNVLDCRAWRRLPPTMAASPCAAATETTMAPGPCGLCVPWQVWIDRVA
jgi:Resolvase, N terminal domain